MADYNSSLPVRTQSAGDLEIKIVDATITSQKLQVNSDGSINVNADLTATDLDIRDLAFATDKVDVTGSEVSLSSGTLAALESITVQNGSGGAAVNIQDGGNSITVDGSVTVSATDLDIRDLAFATDKVDVTGSEVSLSSGTLAALENITVSATDLDIRNLVFATDKVDVGGSVVALDSTTLTALENVNAVVTATDLDIRDLNSATDSVTVVATNLDVRDLTHASDSIKVGDGTDFLAINSDGSINVVSQEDPGTERVDYNTSSALAGGSSSNHDFLVTNGGKLYQVFASASGKLKAEVQIETGSATNTFNTVLVGFNSTAAPNIDMELRKYANVPTGARVRVIRTNRDVQSQDVYSTIVLIED